MKFTGPIKERVLPVTQVSAAASAGIAGGHLIPLVMVDLSEHGDIQELLRVHSLGESGDCVSHWIVPLGANRILLMFEFLRPVMVTFALEFDLSTLAPAVDAIIRNHALNIVHGLAGDKYLTAESRDQVFVNIPETGAEPHWERIYLRQIRSDLRERGMPRRLAKATAPQVIEHLRTLVDVQMPPARRYPDS